MPSSTTPGNTTTREMSDEPLPQSGIVLYQTEDGRTRIQCRFEDETLWLTQTQITELFQVTVPTVNEHLKGIFSTASWSPRQLFGNSEWFDSREAGR